MKSIIQSMHVFHLLMCMISFRMLVILFATRYFVLGNLAHVLGCLVKLSVACNCNYCRINCYQGNCMPSTTIGLVDLFSSALPNRMLVGWCCGWRHGVRFAFTYRMVTLKQHFSFEYLPI